MSDVDILSAESRCVNQTWHLQKKMYFIYLPKDPRHSQPMKELLIEGVQSNGLILQQSIHVWPVAGEGMLWLLMERCDRSM